MNIQRSRQRKELEMLKRYKNQESKESTNPKENFKKQPMRTKESHWI